MVRQTVRDKGGRRPAAAALVLASIMLSACIGERPAVVLRPAPTDDRASLERANEFTVRDGESLSAVASYCKTTIDALRRMNDVNAAGDIYPGQILRVPTSSCAAPTADVPRPKPRPQDERLASVRPQPRPDYDDPSLPARPQRNPLSWWTGSADDSEQDAADARFVWPVEGRVILGFGRSLNGQRNDGINIATREGTPIHAAAAGTVTYAGNELRGYGNLVLIRHDDGYVTAYAHAQSIRVARGQYVAQGEVIGTAGETGDVEKPQLHFEIRRGVRPLDPRHFLSERSS